MKQFTDEGGGDAASWEGEEVDDHVEVWSNAEGLVYFVGLHRSSTPAPAGYPAIFHYPAIFGSGRISLQDSWTDIPL